MSTLEVINLKRLIAAAPIMFNLCQRALLALDEEYFPQLRDELRDVIKHVDGE